MADLGIIFLRRRYPIHWYQSSYIFITGSMPFRYFWATLYIYIVFISLFKMKKKNTYRYLKYVELQKSGLN